MHQAFALARCLILSAAVLGIATDFARAAGDPIKGAVIFSRECLVCHTIGKDEPNRFGPNLFGIAGRQAGTAPGYKYSSQFLAAATWTWGDDEIASFVLAPNQMIRGNRMSVFQGIADSQLDDLIAYVASQK